MIVNSIEGAYLPIDARYPTNYQVDALDSDNHELGELAGYSVSVPLCVPPVQPKALMPEKRDESNF